MPKLRIIPNFFIVGAPKAGTTTLYSYLLKHPHVFMPSKIKEPNYFSRIVIPDSDPRAIRNENKYLGLFKQAKGVKAIGEASPTYLSDPEAPLLIKKFNSDANIIILLRNPVFRSFSHYKTRTRAGHKTESFKQAAKRIAENIPQIDDWYVFNFECGNYYKQVKRYIDTFGRKNVLVLIFEEFIEKPSNSVRHVCEFLSIDKSIALTNGGIVKNAAAIPRNNISKWILSNNSLKIFSRQLFSLNTRERIAWSMLYRHDDKNLHIDSNSYKNLLNYYREDVNKLKVLLDRDLPWEGFDSH